jgi:hypothetical protein
MYREDGRAGIVDAYWKGMCTVTDERKRIKFVIKHFMVAASTEGKEGSSMCT